MNKDLKLAVGLRIKQARMHKGLSQAELAEVIDRSVEAVSNLERGINMPAIEKLQEICEFLGLELASLFDAPPKSKDERVRQDLLREALLVCRGLNTPNLRIAVAQLKALTGE